jgi:O-acetyl-ADP-ribose deacetylase (regulator of RNase III)
MVFANSLKRDIRNVCDAIDSVDICKGDITLQSYDAIVCPDDTKLSGSGGLAKKIHLKAGPLLKKALASIDECPVGQTRVTDGFKLSTTHIIHTATPAWEGGNNYEELKLTSCYSSILQAASDLHCETLAIPSIGTGYHKFPKERAAEIALRTIVYYQAKIPSCLRVSIVCTNEETYEHYKIVFKRMIVKLFMEFYSPESCEINHLSDMDMGPYYSWMVKLRDLETVSHDYSDYIKVIGFSDCSATDMPIDQYYYRLSQRAHLWDYRTCLAYITYLQRKSHWDGYVSYHAEQCKRGGVRNILLRMEQLLLNKNNP